MLLDFRCLKHSVCENFLSKCYEPHGVYYTQYKDATY